MLEAWGVWHWIILGFLLLIAEFILPGVFLFWWGLSALVTAGIVIMFPSLPLFLVVVLFALFAGGLSVLWWRYQHKKDLKDNHQTLLNRRDNTMLSARGVVESLNENGIGRGHFGDTTWRIKGEGLAIGDVIEVISVEGITLNVKKIPS